MSVQCRGARRVDRNFLSLLCIMQLFCGEYFAELLCNLLIIMHGWGEADRCGGPGWVVYDPCRILIDALAEMYQQDFCSVIRRRKGSEYCG